MCACEYIRKLIINKMEKHIYSLNFIIDLIGSLFFRIKNYREFRNFFEIFSGILTKLFYFSNNLMFLHLSPSFLLSIYKDEFDMISFPLSLSSPSASSYVCIFI